MASFHTNVVVWTQCAGLCSNASLYYCNTALRKTWIRNDECSMENKKTKKERGWKKPGYWRVLHAFGYPGRCIAKMVLWMATLLKVVVQSGHCNNFFFCLSPWLTKAYKTRLQLFCKIEAVSSKAVLFGMSGLCAFSDGYIMYKTPSLFRTSFAGCYMSPWVPQHLQALFFCAQVSCEEAVYQTSARLTKLWTTLDLS